MRFGDAWTYAQIQALALEVIRGEVAFNRKAGLGPETDRLPEWMMESPLAPHNALFDVSQEELARIWEEV